MFLTMDDGSAIADFGRELGKSNKIIIEISDNFLEVLKMHSRYSEGER